MKYGLIALMSAVLASCSPPAQNAPPPTAAAVTTEAPAGAYHLDPAHSTLTFRVNHIGFSNYTASFASFSAELTLDPAHPELAHIGATIDARSLTLPSPPAGFLDTMLGADWFDAAQYPTITFQSTAVERTGPNTARVTGDLTLHGVTRPVSLDVTFNGGYAGHQLDPQARIGFSAHGSFNRSDFGMGLGVPQEGSTMGVSDAVEVIIETELSGPAWVGAAPAQ